MQVGAANAGLPDANENIVDPDLGHRNVLEPKTRRSPRLDERGHCSLKIHTCSSAWDRPLVGSSIAKQVLFKLHASEVAVEFRKPGPRGIVGLDEVCGQV